MSQNRIHYSRGVIGLPSVFVAVAWIALWLVWPSGGKVVSPMRSPASPRVFYVQLGTGREKLTDSLPFVDGISPASILHHDEDEPAESLLSQRVRRPRYLERSIELKVGTASGITGSLSGRVSGMPPGGYRSQWRDEHVFSQEPGQNLKVIVRPSGDLKKYGFKVPELPIENIKRRDKPWMVVVYVQTGDNGWPEHVFLESGCDDEEVNAMIVRAMYRGCLSTLAVRCAGRVTVSFGRQ